MKITIPQQSLNLLRQFLAQPGWAKTTKDIYLAGKILAEQPEPDLSWLKQPAEIFRLSADERATYAAADKKWADTPVEVEITETERDMIKKMLEKFSADAAIQPSKFSMCLFAAFGLKPE